MFDLKHESLFTPMFGIRYLTNLDDKFCAYNFPGQLYFYPGNPLYIVNVALYGNKSTLKEDDIEIVCGDRNCSSLIDDMIKEKKDLIFEMCKSYYRPYFVLDVEKMQIIEADDFTALLPIRGLNTLFRFENNLKSAYFMLINTTTNISNDEIMSWFRSYIYSGSICLSPLMQPTNHSKQFLQVLCGLSVSQGKSYNVSTSEIILSSPMNDMGEFDIEVPGNNIVRFNELLEKSVEQSGKKKGKKK
jgi:hypothetical protein